MTKRPYEIRDPIHGFIKLSQTEWNLINTKVFQRLRRIRQLAMTFLVYPGAVHTRFDHSIGVMHVAGRICTRLQELNPTIVGSEDVDRVRLAALLHDVGHGPFSHVSERLLEKCASEGTDKGEGLEKIHEKITVDIVQSDPQIKRILSDDERNFVIDMIQGKPTSDWRRDIVSSDLDADKMDYLLRDGYFTGVKYGEYDLEKVIESFLIDMGETDFCTDTDEEETALAISSKAIYALEQLLLARYHMTQQVYWHRVSLISNEMIIRGISLAIEGENPEMMQLYQYDRENKDRFIENYLNYHDEKLVEFLRNCKQQKVCEIFSRLYERNLFKMIAEFPLKDETLKVKRRLLGETEDKTQKRQLEQEKKIAELLKIDADYVIIRPLQIQNPNYGSRSSILDPEAITIFDENEAEAKPVSDYESELFFARSAFKDEISLETWQVYALVEGWSQEKQNGLELQEEIQTILRSA